MARRQWETGANRDTDEGKIDFEGALSPIVLLKYGEYMRDNSFLADGTFRKTDNWQKGFPEDVLMKSLTRHFMDVWLHHRGQGDKAQSDYETALCAVMFNVMGLLHKELDNAQDHS